MLNFEEENKIDGAKYAIEIRQKIAENIVRYGIKPRIAVILVGNFAPSEIYVRNKMIVATKLGIQVDLIRFNETITEEELIKEIQVLNNNINIHGMIIQMPLPSGINSFNVLMYVSPEKDIDGLHPYNAGLLHYSKDVPYRIEDVLNNDFENIKQQSKMIGRTLPFVSCTPLGCLHLIEQVYKKTNQSIIGKSAVVIGNSNLVGKPMARLLLQSGATTTTLHSKSMNIDYIIKNADIIVSATGAGYNLGKIKEDAILIDVAIRKDNDGNILGDLNYKEIVKTNKITPVPKGVGPMTIASLMLNSYIAGIKNKK